MDNKELLRAIGDIDDMYLNEQDLKNKSKGKVINMKFNKKIIYMVTSCVAMFILCIGIITNINAPTNPKINSKHSIMTEDLQKEKEESKNGSIENNNDKIVNNEDADVNVKERPRENISKSYPDYYAGKYIDNNGNNIVLLCEDSQINKKQVCSLLGISESKTIFKTAKYSYNYLENLQSKISQKMSNKEIPFVISSALMDSTNNIIVTVTSNKEEDLKKLQELDTIGGAIKIDYHTNHIVKEDLLVNRK